MTSKVSVIIPVYNVENYVPRCLDSVLNQTGGDIEIIVIDDGSTDTSGRIADAYRCEHPQIRVIHQTNQGISAARNQGLAEANGKYVLFVDSDDYIAENMISAMLKQAERTGADMVISKAVHDEDGRQREMFAKKFDESEILSGMEAMKSFWGDEINGEIWNKLIRRDVMLKHHILFPAEKLYEDAPVLIQIFQKANRIAFVDQNLYYYCHRKESITRKPTLQSLYDHISIINTIEKNVDQALYRRQYKKQFQYFLLKQLYYNIYQLNQLYSSDRKAYKAYKAGLKRYTGLLEYRNLLNNPSFSLSDKVRLLLVKMGFAYLLRYRPSH